jgi:hypothetical protein
MQNLYQIALVTHIIGLTTMAGITLASFMLARQFWKLYSVDKIKAAAVNESAAKLSVLLGVGIILLIVSGITMMVIVKGAYGQQIWFRVKMLLVLTAIINGVVVGRKLGKKLGMTIAEERSGVNVGDRLVKAAKNVRTFYVVQLTIFLVIFTLSVFKFN